MSLLLGFEISLPKYNLDNDNQYSIFLRNGDKGFFLFNIEKHGLKLVATFHDGRDENAQHFLNFPEVGYQWHFQKDTPLNEFPDLFLQPLYHMGPAKETLLHWQTHEGHHAFIAIHRNEDGNFEVHPKAFLRAQNLVNANATWVLRPKDRTNTFISATHHDAADKVVLWNGLHGCAVLSLDAKESGTYQIHQLHHIPIGGKFHDDCEFTFENGDEFFYPNHSLKPKRREQHAQLYQATQTSDRRDEEPRYRMHIYSRVRQKTFALDFVEESSENPMAAHVQQKGIRFKEMSPVLSVTGAQECSTAPASSADLDYPWNIQAEVTPEKTAVTFFEDYLGVQGFETRNSWGSHMSFINKSKFDDALDKTCEHLRRQGRVTSDWITKFRDAAHSKLVMFDIMQVRWIGGLYLSAILLVGCPIVYGVKTRLYDGWNTGEAKSVDANDAKMRMALADQITGMSSKSELSLKQKLNNLSLSLNTQPGNDELKQQVEAALNTEFADESVVGDGEDILINAISAFQGIASEASKCDLKLEDKALLNIPRELQWDLFKYRMSISNVPRGIACGLLCVGLVGGGLYALTKALPDAI